MKNEKMRKWRVYDCILSKDVGFVMAKTELGAKRKASKENLGYFGVEDK